MNYFHINVELNGTPVCVLVADTVPVVPGQSKQITFQVHYALPDGERELLLVLQQDGWRNESDRVADAGLPLIWQCFPEMIEPHLLPDEKVKTVAQEEIDRIGAGISEYMMPVLRDELAMYSRNLANSFFA